MAVYQVNGERFNVPDNIQGAQLEETLMQLSQTQQAPEPESQADPNVEAEESLRDTVNSAILDLPGGKAVTEFTSAVNRGAVNLLDFISADQINNVLQLAGSDSRIPTFAEKTQPAIEGNFMEPGLARDAVRAGGEFVAPAVTGGTLLRTAAAAVPKLANPTVTQGVVKQLGGSTAAQDVTGAVLSGVGAEVGEEIGGTPGALIGSVFAPVAGMNLKPALTKAVSAGKAGIESIMKPLAAMSDDGASTLLAEAMVREGLSPNDVIARLNQLGPEALPADVGINFARLLRTASNKIPRIEGAAGKVLADRQLGQGNRLLAGFDEAAGTKLSVDDEVSRLNTILKPRINKLYEDAGSQSIQLSPKLNKLLSGKSSLGRAQRRAQLRLSDKRAAGDKVNNITIIDATKQELDDQIGRSIRQGENNKARDLIRLKNIMVDEADKAIPVYKQARDMFAGKASLENAASNGEMFLKMKPSDINNLVKTYGKSEQKLFQMGAKKAILDKIDDLQTNADAVKRLFGKNGDIKKLKMLFDDDAAFDRFSSTLKRESDFIMTRRAAQANSTTAKQLSDEESAFSVLSDAAQLISNPSGQANFLKRIVLGLGRNKTDAVYIKSLEEAGDILLIKGIEPDRIKNILLKGNAKMIESRLKQAFKKPTIQPYLPSAITGASITGEQQ